MKQRKKHMGVQGHALLYGRSSKAIRIVNGEVIGGRVDIKHRPPKKTNQTERVVLKNYKMNEDTKRRLDNLQDPLTIINRSSRAQKYESSNTAEKYEYGLSDW